MRIPFVGPTYQMDAVTFDTQRCVNLYAIVSESGTSKEPSALRSTPGKKLFVTAGGGPIRGGITAANNRAFVVSGGELYEINTDKTATLRGTLNTQIGRVSMAENGLQLMITDGLNGYIFTYATNAFAQITDVDFPQPASVTFLDGYFIVNRVNTNEYYISAINNGLSWVATDFSEAQANPDNIVRVFADNGNLWLLGERSTEVHQNTGAAVFPFERIGGAVFQTGCAAFDTVQTFDNTIAWLGIDAQGRGVVWKAEGYNARRISTQAIEKKIAESTDFTDSYAYVYHEQGHVFYCLQVRGLDTTLVYDGATGLWHERAFNNALFGTLEQDRASCHFFFAQKNLVGDRETGKVYEQSLYLYDDDGVEIRRIRISPHIADEKKLLRYSSFELDLEIGQGLQSGQGQDPQVMLSYSSDGGFTWSDQLWRSAGKVGQYNTRVVWYKLGSDRDRVWKIEMSDPIFWQINGAYINAA